LSIKDRSDVLQGTLDMLVLKALQLEPMHGWGITERIEQWSESLAREQPLHLLTIDYLGLVDLSATQSGMQDVQSLNQVVRQAKGLAASFNHGKGISILSPFQSNREGYKEAMKSEGRYNLTAMAWANEAERSADNVFSVYLDASMRSTNELVIGHLKHREGPVVPDLVRVFADPKTRRIDDLSVSAGAGGGAILDL
jgi:hypothetical protein